MTKSCCRLLVYVDHDLIANFYMTNMSLNPIRENKIIAKIFEFTVVLCKWAGWSGPLLFAGNNIRLFCVDADFIIVLFL